MNDTALLIGGGIALAATAAFLSSSSSSGASRGSLTDGGATSGFGESDMRELFERVENASSGGSSSSSSSSLSISPTEGSDGYSLDDLQSISQGQFEEAIVSRTGYLSSGFDAAGRVSQLSRGNTVGL